MTTKATFKQDSAAPGAPGPFIFAIVPLEAVLDTRLTGAQLRMLVTLLTFRNKNTDVACVKRETIAARLGCAVEYVSRTTTQLEKLGWLHKTGKGGFSKATQYRITVPEMATVSNQETVTSSSTVSEVSNSGQTVNGRQFGNGSQTGGQNSGQSGRETVDGLARGKEQNRTDNRTEFNNQDCVFTKSAREATAAASAFGPITADWQPSDDCKAMLGMRSVPPEFIADSVPEFILFWRGTAKCEHPGGWDQKFLKHCNRQWQKHRAALNDPSQLATHLPDDFWPTPQTERELAGAGIGKPHLTALVAEFKRYWSERREAHFAWNAKFHAWALRQLPRLQSADNQTFEDRVTDVTWAEGM